MPDDRSTGEWMVEVVEKSCVSVGCPFKTGDEHSKSRLSTVVDKKLDNHLKESRRVPRLEKRIEELEGALRRALNCLADNTDQASVEAELRRTLTKKWRNTTNS